MSGSLSEIIAALQLKGTQIILTLVRACSSKAQLIMVYWFMAPSCMAQASFCVLLGVHAKEHTQIQRQKLLAGYDLFSAP